MSATKSVAADAVELREPESHELAVVDGGFWNDGGCVAAWLTKILRQFPGPVVGRWDGA